MYAPGATGAVVVGTGVGPVNSTAVSVVHEAAFEIEWRWQRVLLVPSFSAGSDDTCI